MVNSIHVSVCILLCGSHNITTRHTLIVSAMLKWSFYFIIIYIVHVHFFICN